MYVEHGEMIAGPLQQAARINQFLDHRLDMEAMAQIVDPSLYRQRSDTC
jgi:hypothetical protein